MIIYSKINAVYSKHEIYEIFPTITARKIIFFRDIPRIETIAKYCSFKKINYSFDDFLEDYPLYKNYKCAELMYEIYKKGYSILQFRKKYNISSYLENMIKNGLDFNCPIENGYRIIEVLKYNIDLKTFKIDKYDTHIELFGNLDQLKAFKEKYGINYEVIYEPYKKSWHLAFRGMLADYIRIYK